MRTRTWLGALAVVAAMLAAGCGVPTSTGVQVEGPVNDAGAPGGDEVRLPRGPDDAQNEAQLVDYFLQAGAGDPDDAVARLREFVHSEQRDEWRPDPQVMVVREEREPIFTPVGPTQQRVRLEVTWIGTLSDGAIEPRDGSESREYEFDVVREPVTRDGEANLDEDEGPLRIANPPNVVLMSDEALATGGSGSGYLLPTPVYFWDSDHRLLVPDLRWLPTALPVAQRAQAKLEWLIDGPPTWLDSLAHLPSEVALEGRVVLGEERLDVTLTPAAADVRPGTLDAQIWWTLRDEVSQERTAWLTIDGQERKVAPALAANPAVEGSAGSPASFVVVDGAIEPHLPPDGGGVPLPEAVDADVRAAALNRAGEAALVHLDADDGYGLTIATPDGAVTTELAGAAMSRPVWLREPGGVGLVAADGVLYRFDRDGDPSPLQVPGLTDPTPQEIGAIAVAPDGRRMAMVIDGRLYVTSLVRRDDGTLSVNTPQRLPTTADALAGVTFLEETRLAVVGQAGGRSLLYELTIDGAFERELLKGDLGAPPLITNVVGSPAAPSSVRQRVDIMYETADGVYRYSPLDQALTVSLSDLGLDPDGTDGQPHAPFYLD